MTRFYFVSIVGPVTPFDIYCSFLYFINTQLFCHHGCELLEADEPITVAVRLGHHPCDLSLTEPLPHVGHDLLQLWQTEKMFYFI